MTPPARRLVASAGMVALAATVVGWLAADGESALAPIPQRLGSLSQQLPATRLAPASSYAAVSERPLFAPSRRPQTQAPLVVAEPEQRPPPAPPPTLPVTLVGILISPEGRFAVLRWPNGRSATLEEGGVVEGWTLRRVLPDRASFFMGAASTELTFSAHQAPPAIPLPAAATRRRS